MNVQFKLVLGLLSALVFADGYKCPNGADIYNIGMNNWDNQAAVNEHNRYRKMILNGRVNGQPRGKNIPMLTHDNNLAYGAQEVVKSCELRHKEQQDRRFSIGVGQNLYISWSSVQNTTMDWHEAVKSWFDEHRNYRYSNASGNALHYSQLVWAKTKVVGCSFSAYYDWQTPQLPYARLYACNYGPAGNVHGETPYERA